ncbi:MAG TPA: polysaccharide biosynthesis tyrosine autokinase [Vicinamibacterales bacterium]|nr:polysaccharide biosynthesis tyrosine autokinase [Vicinamibacterales bacterium]
MFDAQDLQPPAGTTESAPPYNSSGGSVHVLDRLSGLLRHRRIAGAAFAVIVTLLMLQTYSKIPLYRASARVEIRDERTMAAVGTLNANDPMFWQDADQYYNTQYSILRSRGLAKRVVRKLQLQNHPLFNGSAPQSRGPLAVVREARQALGAAVRNLFAAKEERNAAPEAPSADESALESSSISQFLGGVDIVPEKSTRLVEIAYVSTDPAFAALAATTLAEEYTQQNLDLRLETVNKNLAWLSDEVVKQEQKVTEAEAAMAGYREQQNALSLEDRQNIVVARLNALNDTATRARTNRLQKEASYNQMKGIDAKSDAADTFPVIATNPGVMEAKTKLNELVAEKARLSSRYLPGHPDLIKVEGQIENARATLVAQRARVIESAKNEFEAAFDEERSYSGQLESQKGAAMDLDRKSGAYLVLQRQAETNRQVYQSLLQQQKELRVVSNSRTNNVHVMDRAEPPGAPFSPNARRDWFTAVVAGLIVALGLAFGLEYLDDTIKTPDDVAQRLRLPLLGLVPSIPGARVPLLSEAVPDDFGEAFRSLRTSLVFTSGASGPRIIAVTSSQPLEGKTTTACNLGMVLALGGARVLLVDADMRRPGLHSVVGAQNDIGLSHLLVGQARVRDAVQKTSEPNLFVISAGRIPPNPSELLTSERMNALLANLRSGPFDWVIIDTPPILAVTDAVIVARGVAGVVFVVGSEMTRRVHAERAIELLAAGKPKSLGIVLNRVDLERNKYYYSRYYGYHYKNYYGAGTKKSA